MAIRARLIRIPRLAAYISPSNKAFRGFISKTANSNPINAQVEARIHEVEAILKQAEIIEEDESAKEIVRIGSVVTLKDLSDGEVATYTIVGTTEADPFEGKISNESPVVQAILDKKAGDVVTISKAAIPYDVEILEVK